ncbi:MAG: hypothetical protein A3I66_07710 [Burkholderiales bacterium RIFCSPLOWO2_02_FULL_57_36]|nr:MAG: hypothetical protein A3I66_07710 [Burkholderiales bacterium RIFCSPLOWO2_02_FULL_57_36]
MLRCIIDAENQWRPLADFQSADGKRDSLVHLLAKRIPADCNCCLLNGKLQCVSAFAELDQGCPIKII